MTNPKLTLLLFTILASVGVLAQESTIMLTKEKHKAAPNVIVEKEKSEGIVVDESNFKEIFNQSVVQESSVLEKRTRSFDVEIGAAYNSINDLILSNNYFTVNYTEELKAVPSMKFSLAKDIWSNSKTAASGLVNLGYSMKQARVLAESKRGTKLTDQVALQWIPLSAGAQIKQKIPGTQHFSAFFAPSIGSQYFYQTGNLDGIDQGYWIGFWNLRAGLVLFEQTSKKIGSVFEGVVLGGNLSQAVVSRQKFSSWSADLGIKFAL
ncbi:MAG: hypothetical protein KA116_01720 [Proteobacteria bacterium]|nr:hypothetical protein [Pseudomonadota bacterium]